MAGGQEQEFVRQDVSYESFWKTKASQLNRWMTALFIGTSQHVKLATQTPRTQIEGAKVCYDCPLALDIWVLCPAIHDEACDIACSGMYDDAGTMGVVIVQGAYVIADPLLVREADASIWLDQVDLDLCKIRHLIEKGKWNLPLDALDREVEAILRSKEDRNDSRLWGTFQHHDRNVAA